MASRVTQQVVEVLSTPAPAIRVTQHALEVLSVEVPGVAARLTQQLLEVLLASPPPPARLTQQVLEVLAPIAAAVTTVRFTQQLLEVLAPGVAQMLPPQPVPVTDPPSGPVQLTLQLDAELLMEEGRIPLVRRQTLAGEAGEMVEVCLPDGTMNLAVVPGRVGQVVALLVLSDKAVQVCIGDVALNQPLALQPWGAYLLLNSDIPGEQMCALSYTPGDGSVATCMVLVLIQARDLSGCGRFAAHPTLAQGLVHCWDFDEESGARVDHVGDITLIEGGTPTASLPGKVGNAADFTGTNWLLNVNTAEASSQVQLLFRPPFTLAFWLWLDAYPTTESGCLVATGNSLASNQYYFYCIVRPDNHRIQMSLMQGFGGAVSALTPPSLGAWHLVVGWSVTAAPGNVGPTSTHIQLDNGAIATTGPGEFTFPFASPLVIGAIGNPGTSARLRGKVDQVMYWNRALTLQSERDEIWNAGRG